MKKFRFIIPRVLCYKSAICLSILFFSQKVSAVNDYGCVVSFGSELHVYYILNPTYPGTYKTSSDDPTTPAGYRRKRVSDADVCVDDFGSSCSIYFTNGTTLFSTGSTSHIYDCPLDDYIPALIIFTIGIALVRLKKATPINVNENIHHHGSL